MNAAILATLLAAHGQCSPAYCRQLAEAILPAARAHQIDPLLLTAVTLHESRARLKPDHLISRTYGFDVGPWQLRCPQTRGSDGIGRVSACLSRFLGARGQLGRSKSGRLKSRLRRQARQAAKLLSWGRRDCRAGAKRWYCPRLWWGRYNPGSRRWARSVEKLWANLKAARLPRVDIRARANTRRESFGRHRGLLERHAAIFPERVDRRHEPGCFLIQNCDAALKRCDPDRHRRDEVAERAHDVRHFEVPEVKRARHRVELLQLQRDLPK